MVMRWFKKLFESAPSPLRPSEAQKDLAWKAMYDKLISSPTDSDARIEEVARNFKTIEEFMKTLDGEVLGAYQYWYDYFEDGFKKNKRRYDERKAMLKELQEIKDTFPTPKW
jgi:hypothetical protein